MGNGREGWNIACSKYLVYMHENVIMKLTSFCIKIYKLSEDSEGWFCLIHFEVEIVFQENVN